MTKFIYIYSIGLLSLLLLACHGAPRKNPFDPALTTAVELSLSVADTTGTALLNWSAYEGDAAFAVYWVLRREQGLEQVDTLAVLVDVEQTSFVDTSLAPGTLYTYRVSTVNVAGFEVESPAQILDSFELPPVHIVTLDFDAVTASAALAWTPYIGPRFRTYEIRRQSAGLDVRVVATLNDSGATQFRDDDLLGNTEYSYTVVVLTERDEEVVSGVRSGAFHRLVDSWELPFDQRAFARIYSEGGRIFVLAKEGGSYSLITSLLEYDAAGQRLNENEILAFGSASGRAMAFSPTGDGGRLFIMANGGLIAKHYEPGERTENWDYVVMAQEADGQMALREHVLSVDGLPTLTDAAQRTVLGEIALSRHVDAETGDLNQGAYRNPQVTRSGSILYAEDFSDLPAFVNARITHAFGSDYFTQWNGWDLYGGGRWTDHGFIILWSGAMYRADPAWQDFQLEVEVSPIGVDTFNPTIYIGGDTYSRYGIGLDLINQEAQLNWQFTPPDGLDMEPQEISLSEPFALVEGLSYWLRVGAVDGEVSASVASPVLANGVGTRGFPWVNMIHLGDIPAVTVYDTPYLLTPDWQWQPLNTFNSGVSELRTWQSRGRRQIGVCLPEDNKLLVGTVPDGLENEWSDLLNSAIGPETGRAADFLFNPTSFDVGPDGRIYVLDAGNARIVVYDSARNYITEWGSYGSGAGQFDFGAQGGRLASGEPSFTGSIAVDDEGFVYVVDPVNGRIQKFEP